MLSMSSQCFSLNNLHFYKMSSLTWVLHKCQSLSDAQLNHLWNLVETALAVDSLVLFAQMPEPVFRTYCHWCVLIRTQFTFITLDTGLVVIILQDLYAVNRPNLNIIHPLHFVQKTVLYKYTCSLQFGQNFSRFFRSSSFLSARANSALSSSASSPWNSPELYCR